MKSIEQMVNAVRDLRFAIDRLPPDELAEAPPTTRQALVTQARALEADLETLLLTLAENELAGL